ncbi:MAG: septal ring lytic transglycosylase RlpA family protein [Bradyrhizobium sp.]
MLKSKKSTAGTRTRSRAAIAVIAATLLIGGTATASAKSRHHHRSHHSHVVLRRHHLHAALRRHHRHHARRVARAAWHHGHIGFAFSTGRVFSGLASYYGSGRRTASGQRFNPHALTCAHRTLPFGTRLLVTHNGRSVVVTVNDRGPFVHGRVLDLSTAAARAVGLTSAGVGRVTFKVIS